MPDPIKPQNFQNDTPAVYQGEQASGGGDGIAQGLGFAAQLAGKAFGASPYGALPGLLTGGSGAGGLAGDIGSNQQQFMELLRLQNQMQLQAQQFSTLTNVSKTEHETRMAAVRNIRS